MKCKKWIFITLVMAFVAGFVLKLLNDAGSFKTIKEVHFKSCHKVPLIGPEDMAILPDSPYVVISSDPRNEKAPFQAGTLEIFDPRGQKIINIEKMGFPLDFHPHGLDARSIPGGNEIYVVDQVNEQSTAIDIFEFNNVKKNIRFIRRLQSPLLTAANDLVLLGPDEFFYTRDSNTKTQWVQKLWAYLQVATGSVGYYKKGNFRPLVNSLFFANGVTYDFNRHLLYISEMLGRRIRSYKWDQEHLMAQKEIDVPHGIDNLTWNGVYLYGAGHPKLLSLAQMQKDRLQRAPSVVLEIDPELSHVQTVYEDDGDEISASSVALRLSPKALLVGSVFDDHFLSCEP